MGFCICGSGVTHVENRIYAFEKGDLQFVPSGVSHLSAAEPGVETKWQWISVDIGRVLEEGGFSRVEEYEAMCAGGFAGVFHPWEHKRLAEIMCRFRDSVLTADEYGDAEQMFLVGQLITECARIGKERQAQGSEDDIGGKIRPAVLYIRRHFHNKEAMRQEQIAGVCGISISHLRALFKRETGLTVQEFIIQTRLAKAAFLLQNTDMSIMRVAMESGFTQIACFNRMFLRRFGQSPSAFRKQNKTE